MDTTKQNENDTKNLDEWRKLIGIEDVILYNDLLCISKHLALENNNKTIFEKNEIFEEDLLSEKEEKEKKIIENANEKFIGLNIEENQNKSETLDNWTKDFLKNLYRC